PPVWAGPVWRLPVRGGGGGGVGPPRRGRARPAGVLFVQRKKAGGRPPVVATPTPDGETNHKKTRVRKNPPAFFPPAAPPGFSTGRPGRAFQREVRISIGTPWRKLEWHLPPAPQRIGSLSARGILAQDPTRSAHLYARTWRSP